MYQITPTQFFYPLSVLYHESGLEVTPSQEAPEGTLALWRCDDLEDGSLLGAATLQMRAGHHVLAHLAVAEPARGQGLGAELLAVAEAQAVRLGAKELWLVGKVPDFYRQFHWVEVPREDAPVTNSRWTASPALCAKCCPDENLKREPFRISCGTALFFL